MKLSRYFSDHARAYDAEMDDLVSDSEGKNVLEKRLKEKRSQLDFLVMMMDDSPEMLAVAFHQGFRFPSPKAMDLLVALEPEEFPDWDKLARTVILSPWAQTLAARVLQEPSGERFMTIAACLEYLYTRADDRGAPVEEDDEEDDLDINPEEQEARDREDAGAAWMEEQGFDPKPPKA
ncbi:hypothetical protein [Rhodoferax sp.]|uniref:hypothetical protein n=1 Tax=Rhodoferax sp. TaxID=50421 RepID=UPI00374D28BD